MVLLEAAGLSKGRFYERAPGLTPVPGEANSGTPTLMAHSCVTLSALFLYLHKIETSQ